METKKINETLQIPEDYREDLQRAVEILRQEGCSEIFLFGSLAEGQYHEKSDIDLAVRGCPKAKFFYVLGKLLRELNHSVDLVDLDQEDAFARYLQKEGDLVQIG